MMPKFCKPGMAMAMYRFQRLPGVNRTCIFCTRLQFKVYAADEVCSKA